MAEFDTGIPSVRLVQQWIKEKKQIEVKLSTDEVLLGNIIWQDPQCLYLIDDSQQNTLIWRQALVCLKPQG